MPTIDGLELAPDEAVARGLCPECGRPLQDVNVEEHAAAHWPREGNAEAARRRELMRAHAKAQAEHATANNPPPNEKD